MKVVLGVQGVYFERVLDNGKFCHRKSSQIEMFIGRDALQVPFSINL